MRGWLALGLLLLSCATQAEGDLFEQAAARYKISTDLLRSIALVESKMHPWAININLEGFQPESPAQAIQLIQQVAKMPWLLRVDYQTESHRMFFHSGLEAQQALRQLQARARQLETEIPRQWEIRKLDARSVDIGLMQINWKFHGRHFDSMQQLFDPAVNLDYAARYLKALLDEHGDLEQAVAHYHSNTPEFQLKYLQAFRSVYQKQLNESRPG